MTTKCYFYGSNLADDKLTRNRGIISFAIPDYGVVFRSQYEGNTYECEYAAALALIRFIQLNHQHFQSKKITFLTDSAIVVCQVSRKVTATKRLKRLRDLVLFYKRKYGFELDWVPSRRNRAQSAIDCTATSPKAPKFNYAIFEESTKKKQLKSKSGDSIKMAS
ncbi:MAG: hypothetical protein KAT58_09255 [candidate division Zixibacteria bacterium]|nr:hypothetical protein [candidate division Zixibacteria bacterium]